MGMGGVGGRGGWEGGRAPAEQPGAGTAGEHPGCDPKPTAAALPGRQRRGALLSAPPPAPPRPPVPLIPRLPEGSSFYWNGNVAGAIVPVAQRSTRHVTMRTLRGGQGYGGAHQFSEAVLGGCRRGAARRRTCRGGSCDRRGRLQRAALRQAALQHLRPPPQPPGPHELPQPEQHRTLSQVGRLPHQESTYNRLVRLGGHRSISVPSGFRCCGSLLRSAGSPGGCSGEVERRGHFVVQYKREGATSWSSRKGKGGTSWSSRKGGGGHLLIQ